MTIDEGAHRVGAMLIAAKIETMQTGEPCRARLAGAEISMIGRKALIFAGFS